jgi:hypothetical protein
MLPDQRIRQIVDEGLAMYAANDARIVAERRSRLQQPPLAIFWAMPPNRQRRVRAVSCWEGLMDDNVIA